MAPPGSAPRRSPDYRPDKFAELIVYISRKCETDKRFGATKLNKLLYYSDFRAYARFGAPITGATYQRIEHGPAPRQYLPVVKRLIARGEVEFENREHFARKQERLIAKRDPDLEVFSDGELELVDGVIQEFWGRNAREVSDKSHKEGWRLVEPGETIPYWTVFVDLDRKPTADDLAWAKRMGSDARALQVQ